MKKIWNYKKNIIKDIIIMVIQLMLLKQIVIIFYWKRFVHFSLQKIIMDFIFILKDKYIYLDKKQN